MHAITPPQLAKRLGVSPDKVLHWIRSGQLRAVNVASDKHVRARWRILEDDLSQFLSARGGPEPVTPRRPMTRRKKRYRYFPNG